MKARPRRSGFTLLELIVVTAIIAALASLLLAATLRARAVAANLEDYRELINLHHAIESFCRDDRLGNIGYVPSKLDPSGGAPNSPSANYLRKLFPYTGGGLRLPPAQLEGSQIFVLMLGGPDNKGWATDLFDPSAAYGMRIRFFEFDPNRLKDVHGNGYPSYLDRHGTPIAYFSPFREGLDWTAAYQQDNPKLGQLYTANPGLGFPPYADMNMTTFQLISAGPDKKFGQKGATWTPPTGPMVYPVGDPGNDDVANFAKRLGGR